MLEEIKDMDGNEFVGHAAALCDNISTVGDKALNHLISGMNCPSSELDIFENAENKIPSDLLYYDWPEIGNFEDVDRMFRSCDSIFGLGVSKEDELSWLSAGHDLDLGEAGDVLNSDTKFPCPEPDVLEHISGDHASIRGCSVNGSMDSTPIGSRDCSWNSERTDYYRNFATEPAIVDNKNGFNSLEQINKQKKHIKPQNRPNEAGKGYNFQNGSIKCSKGLPNEVMQFSGLSYNQVFPRTDTQHLPQCPKSYSHVQNPVSNVHSDNSLLSDLASVNRKPSKAKSDTKGLSPLLPRDAFGTLGELHCIQSSGDNPSLEISEQCLTPFKNGGATLLDPASGVTSATTEEMGSLNVPKNSMSFNKDDFSLEAASFCQLQLVMKQLDLQTKLSIRDGLYRLARNATKRHNHTSPNPNIRCGSMSNETKSFTDMETGTNPIDRSIAHLLFHQVSDSSSTAPSHELFPTTVCIE